MIKFWSICRNTFVQTIRQPIFGVLLMVTFLILVVSLPLAVWTMGEKGGDYEVSDQKMLIQLGLGSLLATGLLLSAFSASAAVSREIEDRTALTVISKPVSRGTFVLGKFAGVAAAVTVAIYLTCLVFLMTVRHGVVSSVSTPMDWPVIVLGLAAGLIALVLATAGNIYFGWTFISALVWSLMATLTVAMGVIGFVGKGWHVVPFGAGIAPQLLLSLLLVYMAILVFVAVAVTVSTRWGQVLTLLVCLGVLIVGSMYSFLFDNWSNRLVLVKLLSPLLPNLKHFYTLDALMSDTDIPATYVGKAALYCLLYTGGIIALGMALFQRRSLQADSGSGAMPGAVSLLAWVGRLAAVAAALVGIEALLSAAMNRFDGAFDPVAYKWLAGALSANLALSGAAGLIVLAGAVFMLWTYFGRGVAWTYWLVLPLTVLDLARYLTGLIRPQTRSMAIIPDHLQGLLAGAIIAGIVLLVLLLPSTRRHFHNA